MKLKTMLLSLLFLCVSFSSCSSLYEPAVQILPEHIKKVYVKPFSNNTNQFGLETKFTNAVINEIMNDGRLSIVNNEDEADGTLTAVIKRYILQPLTYDVNMIVDQYKMWVIVSVAFVDKKNNVTLWTEPNMEGICIYKDLTNNVGANSSFGAGDAKTEEEARDDVWEKISRKIVKRTIKGFGSATSVSEKKVPN